MSELVREKKNCRMCQGTALTGCLDLGLQAPANALLKPEEVAAEQKFPLALNHCHECGQVQTTHVVSPELLFRNYVYFSSTSVAMSAHFAAYAKAVADRFVPEKGLVVEIGSNDGVLLKTLIGRPLRILGVDPARNVAEVARKAGVPTIAEFWNSELAASIGKEHGKASAIIGNNVIAHIDDSDSVMKGVSELLAPDGVFVMEAPWVVPFLEHLEFDTVYHEHLSYLGVGGLQRLFARHGLEAFEVQDQKVHGGTIRVMAQRKGGGRKIDPSVAAHVEAERAAGLFTKNGLKDFEAKVKALTEKLRALVFDLKKQGKRVVGCTAPAKGNVLLQHAQLGPKEIDYLYDAQPAKQGLLSPGVHVPIISPEKFREDSPDYALMFAWNLKDELIAREAKWREKGGKFIIPVPRCEVV